jgi:hypothetical protein
MGWLYIFAYNTDYTFIHTFVLLLNFYILSLAIDVVTLQPSVITMRYVSPEDVKEI